MRKSWIFATGSNHYNNFWESESTPVNQKMKTLVLQDYKNCARHKKKIKKKSEQQSWQQVENGPAGMRKRGGITAKSSFSPFATLEEVKG